MSKKQTTTICGLCKHHYGDDACEWCSTYQRDKYPAEPWEPDEWYGDEVDYE